MSTSLENIASNLFPDQPYDPAPEMERRFVNGRWTYVEADHLGFLTHGGIVDRSHERAEFIKNGHILLKELAEISGGVEALKD